MNAPTRHLLALAATALRLPDAAMEGVAVGGDGELASAFAVTDLAAACIGAAALAIRQLAAVPDELPRPIHVDRRLAALWFRRSIQPMGWDLPAPWDAIAGDYATADGWIRLHTNAPHHRAAALQVLQCSGERAAVARAVAGWSADALESAIVEHAGCAAAMRTIAQWRIHPQGLAVAAEPLVDWSTAPGAVASAWQPARPRPLAGLKVLDLTRVLAGPVATRFLAGYGADVLRIDPPGWEEDAVAPDVTLGKRCARLDLERADDRATFEGLLATADVLVHGYRPGALAALGYAEAWRRGVNPGLVDVSLDAYGWSGPWRARRGFDSLLQMSTGIAERGMRWKGSATPTPLPMQALDHATGYLMAAAVVRGLGLRRHDGCAATARLSLARTAQLLLDLHAGGNGSPIEDRADDVDPTIERTDWGAARRLREAARIEGIVQAWDRPATRLGSASPAWAHA